MHIRKNRGCDKTDDVYFFIVLYLNCNVTLSTLKKRSEHPFFTIFSDGFTDICYKVTDF